MSRDATKLNKASSYALAAADHILQSVISPVTNDLSVELFANSFAQYVKGGLNANTISLIMSRDAAKLNEVITLCFCRIVHIEVVLLGCGGALALDRSAQLINNEGQCAGQNLSTAPPPPPLLLEGEGAH
ncbi:uncharacterized protein LOC126355242 isoform X1 [Schistocerca gregaria]|uniref:uncharacterized protein LOC126355242 isoform X1 n=1 Tax=Schistocerca gregaria TaxID=7010 RepID=UPI00211E75BB|nr:uncharacterized protein LOC126355242 isoform X1 [Schistocerca gregaria]